MSHAARLLEHLRGAAPAPVPRSGVDEAELAAALDRLRPAAHVFDIFSAMLSRDSSFVLFDFEMFPALLLRRPRKEGVALASEVCVAKNGAGDLYLFDVESGGTRLVVHDQDWTSRAKRPSFDAFLADALAGTLERIEAYELDDAPEDLLARIRCALDIAGEDTVDDEVREKLALRGVISE